MITPAISLVLFLGAFVKIVRSCFFVSTKTQLGGHYGAANGILGNGSVQPREPISRKVVNRKVLAQILNFSTGVGVFQWGGHMGGGDFWQNGGPQGGRSIRL